MKKKKFNLLLEIATLCLCIAAIAFGVYSAKNASLNVSGTVGFISHGGKFELTQLQIAGALKEDDSAYDRTIVYGDGTGETVKRFFGSWGNEKAGKLMDNDTTAFPEAMYLNDIELSTADKDTIKDITITLNITNYSQFDTIFSACEFTAPSIPNATVTAETSVVYATNEKMAKSTDGTTAGGTCVVTIVIKTKLNEGTNFLASLSAPVGFSLKINFEKYTYIPPLPVAGRTVNGSFVDGDLIAMDVDPTQKYGTDEKEVYRVVKVNNETGDVLVMAMYNKYKRFENGYDYWGLTYESDDSTTEKSGSKTWKYTDSMFDRYLEKGVPSKNITSWYDNLNSDAKKAIKTTKITQYSYKAINDESTKEKVVGCVDIERHVFILDIGDIIEYWNGVDHNDISMDSTSDYVTKFFVNSTRSDIHNNWDSKWTKYQNPFLRTAYNNYGDPYIHFSISHGCIRDCYSATQGTTICPAFTINLREFTNWEKVENFVYQIDEIDWS